MTNTGTSGTLHYWLLPYLQAEEVFKQGQPEVAGASAQVWALPKVYSQVIPAYVAPLDFTTTDGTVKLNGATPWGVGDMGANTRVFGGLKAAATPQAWDSKARFATFAMHGTSQTIVFATRYASCGDPPGGSAWAGGNPSPGFDEFIKSGAFFGSDIEDTPDTTEGYTTNPPFQVAPTQKDCNPLFAHAYTTARIEVAMGDAAVRTVSPNLSSKVWGRACHPYWASGGISPDWGE